MALDAAGLKSVEMLIARAKQSAEDALSLADAAGDVGMVRTLKALLVRISDTEANIAGRIKAAGQP